MKLKTVCLISIFLTFLSSQTVAGSSPNAIKYVSIADRTPSWYSMEWITESKYSPEFEVLDTESALGRYAQMTKTITLKDMVKFHGHACDGLVQASAGLKLAFDELFPDGIIDRTDLRILTKNSPCFTDVSAYLTGGRINFGTLETNNALGASWIVQRISDGKTIQVGRRAGVFPEKLERLEKKVKRGKASPEEITQTRDLAWAFSKDLLSHPLENAFILKELQDFNFPKSGYENVGQRGDIKHKNDPY